jgi:hypothetical protein
MDYESFLKTLSIKELKSLIKRYITHIKILTSKKTKPQLIEHLLMHTELKDNKVVTKKIEIGDLPQKQKKEVTKKEVTKKEVTKGETKKEEKITESKKEITKKEETNKEPKKEKDRYITMIKKYSNKKIWDELSKQQKEEICKIVKDKIKETKDKTLLAKLPSHIYDYFSKYCQQEPMMKEQPKKKVKKI